MSTQAEFQYLKEQRPQELFINGYKCSLSNDTYKISAPVGILLGTWNPDTGEWYRWSGYGFCDNKIVDDQFIINILGGVKS